MEIDLNMYRILHINNNKPLLIGNTKRMPWMWISFNGVYKIDELILKLPGLTCITYIIYYVQLYIYIYVILTDVVLIH